MSAKDNYNYTMRISFEENCFG